MILMLKQHKTGHRAADGPRAVVWTPLCYMDDWNLVMWTVYGPKYFYFLNPLIQIVSFKVSTQLRITIK